MKFVCKNKFISAFPLDQDLLLPELTFDNPFQGKVVIKAKKDDNGNLCVVMEVDGHEYF